MVSHETNNSLLSTLSFTPLGAPLEQHYLLTLRDTDADRFTLLVR